MTGLKNYLLVTGEGDLASLTTGMDPAEVEAALEEAVQELVVRANNKSLRSYTVPGSPSLLKEPISISALTNNNPYQDMGCGHKDHMGRAVWLKLILRAL